MAFIDYPKTLVAEDPLHAGLGSVLKGNLDALESACKTYLCSHSNLVEEFTYVSTGALDLHEINDIKEIPVIVRTSTDGTPRDLVVKVDAKHSAGGHSIALRVSGDGTYTTAVQAVDTSWTRYTFTAADPPVGTTSYRSVLGDGSHLAHISIMAQSTGSGTLYLRSLTVIES